MIHDCRTYVPNHATNDQYNKHQCYSCTKRVRIWLDFDPMIHHPHLKLRCENSGIPLKRPKWKSYTIPIPENLCGSRHWFTIVLGATWYCQLKMCFIAKVSLLTSATFKTRPRSRLTVNANNKHTPIKEKKKGK